MLFEAEPFTEIAYQFIVEGFLIVSDYVPWYPILIDDVAANKVHHSFFLHFLKWHSFHPLRKIICCHQYVSMPSGGFRSDGSNHIKTSCIKWPWHNCRMEQLKGFVYEVCMELTCLTLLSIFHAILNHSWPIITNPFDSIMNLWPWLVSPTDPKMSFFNCLICLFFS